MMSKGSKKILHICIIIVIIVAIAFTALMLVLNYNENGETNMPFKISKISIISSTDAIDKEDEDNIWSKIINQNNDIYIYIEKNDDYKKTETIDDVVLSNFEYSKAPAVGEMAIYKPSTNKEEIFENVDEYKTNEIIFSGEESTNIQNLNISNQGGMVAFRCANNRVGIYTSNNDKEIDYNNLLEKVNLKDEDLKTDISCNLKINLSSGKEFIAEINLNLPLDGISKNGIVSKEFTDVDNIVFKRVNS